MQMTLFSRNGEIELLRRQRWLSEEQCSRMTLLSGRRLSGKTSLIAEAYSDKPFLYFKLSGKTDRLLLEEYIGQVKSKLGIYVPKTVLNLRLMMDHLLKIALKLPMTVVLDDFGELLKKNPEYFSVLKDSWKYQRRLTHMNLVLVISNPVHAAQIFDAQGAPLRNALDMKIPLGFLSVADLRNAMESTGREWTNEDLCTMYMVTGGCPKYVAYALEKDAVTKSEILNAFVCRDSPYLWDIRRMLAETLGHGNEVYMALLQLIACGTKSLGGLEERLGGIVVGGHLAKLGNDYNLIVRTRPLLASEKSRNVVRYEISDQMTDFWLRYIEPKRNMIEIGDWDSVHAAMDKDLPLYSKTVLRRYFRQKFSEENGIREIGGDWKAGKDPVYELDIVGLDRKGKHALLADVELEADYFEKDPFLKRTNALKNGALRGYSVDARLFTLADM